MKRIFILVAAMAILSLGSMQLKAQTLAVTSGSGAQGGTVTVSIALGENVEGVDTDAGVAGAAFTINYDSTNLTLTEVTSDTFFPTFTVMGLSESSVEVDGTTYEKALVANLGSAMIAAARVDNGYGDQSIFDLTFEIASDATATSYSIEIVASNINNTDAGYPSGGEDIPMLVGIGADGTSYPEREVTTNTPGTITVTTGVVDTDGDGIDDTWETTHFGDLTTADSDSNYDHDSYTDKQEFLNSQNSETDPSGADYDPTIVNIAGGTGTTHTMLWKNDNGTTIVWSLNSDGTRRDVQSPGGVPSPWQLASTDDFDGDSSFDILWYNTSTGDCVIWYLYADGTKKGTGTPGGVPSPWSIADTADFDGDKITDILWHNADTGIVAIWYLNANGSRKASMSPGGAASPWEVIFSNDVDGDGNRDLLWQNSTTGLVSIWFLNANGTRRSFTTPGGAPPPFQVIDTADYDSDGAVDLLWQNSTTGLAVIWFLNADGTRKAAAAPGGAAPPWSITATGDVDGNSVIDLIWHNSTTGLCSIWFLNSDGSRASVGYPGGAASPWHIAETKDYDDDGVLDLLWHDGNSGLSVIHFLNSNGTRKSATSPGGAAPPWTIIGTP